MSRACFWRVLPGFVLLLAGGCAAAPRGVARWELQQGGVSENLALRVRLERVCRPLRAIEGLGKCQFAVIESDLRIAYAWPTQEGGRVYVTRGLMEMASDGELAAAAAHEMGHLVEAGHVRVAALTGSRRADDAERRADAAGCSLLKIAGLEPQGMRTLLLKLAAAAPSGREALLARASAL